MYLVNPDHVRRRFIMPGLDNSARDSSKETFLFCNVEVVTIVSAQSYMPSRTADTGTNYQNYMGNMFLFSFRHLRLD